MNLQKKIDKLCTPAYFYFLISFILFLFVLFQNIFNGKLDEFCVGSYSCSVTNVIIVFMLQILYIAFWTFVLQALCDYGYKKFSWFLVLLPFMLLAILIGIYIIKNINFNIQQN